MNVTDREVREDEYGHWSARCKVDGEVCYVAYVGDALSTNDDFGLVKDAPFPCRWESRQGAVDGLEDAIRDARERARQAHERRVRAELLAAHPNGGWEPA